MAMLRELANGGQKEPEGRDSRNLAFLLCDLLAGARMLYKNLPKTVGLRRLTLHKSRTLNSAEVTYLLLVECTHFMDHIGEAANLLPILRDAQGSHYVALRSIHVFA